MSEVSLDEVMRAVEALRRDMQAEIDGLKAELAAVQARQAADSAALRPAAAPPEPSPELLVIMAAAVTAFLGRKVRIRSARLLHPAHEAASPWAQHGRVFVQAAAHNLRHVR